MLLFGRSRSRRGLASALIGEIAAVIDSMERFEEVRKLEGMAIGAEENLDELGAFTLPAFSVYESNADRLDLFDASVQRQIAYFFTSTAFRNWVTTCCAICESSYPESSPRQYRELDGTRLS